MKKYLLLSSLSVTILQGWSQNVAINATGAAANSAAMLDITSTTSGLLIPRMTTTQKLAIASPVQGLTVFDITTNSYWYHNGTTWVEMGLNNGWSLTGNSGTTAGTNFLGTTDAVNLIFKTSATERMRVFSDGRVAVNNTTTFGFSTFFSQATSNNDAVDGNAAGTGYAIYGQNTGTGAGVDGLSNNASGQGMIGININASGTGIIGTGNNGALTYLVAGSGGSFNGSATGLSANATTAGVGQSIYTTEYGNVVRVNYWNGTTQYKIAGTGTVSTFVKDLNNEEVIMHCPESPEIYFTDYGQGQLVNGSAHIDIDPIFAKNVTINEQHPLRVYIQLEGDCNGVYVTNKTAKGFDVIELMHGHSNVKFQWNIVCNRADEDLGNGRVSKNADIRFEKAPQKEAQATAPAQELKRVNNNQ